MELNELFNINELKLLKILEIRDSIFNGYIVVEYLDDRSDLFTWVEFDVYIKKCKILLRKYKLNNICK